MKHTPCEAPSPSRKEIWKQELGIEGMGTHTLSAADYVLCIVKINVFSGKA